MIGDMLNKVICGDCLEVMKDIPDKSVDLVLTDFPYGVGVDYGGYEDTRENLEILVDTVLPEILRISQRSLITCGNHNVDLFNNPDWLLAWTNRAGNGINKYGFNCFQPIIAYGKDILIQKGIRKDVIEHSETSQKNGHPCPKPLGFWKKLLLRGSIGPNDIILDPFLGSGTTAVAAKQLGRNFIGIEINPDYCKIAEQRLVQEELF